MSKKIISVLLAAIMLVAMASVATFATSAEDNGVTCGGEVYLTNVGDVLTYTYTLTTPAAIENVQATVNYDAEKLELINDKSAMFPNLTSGLIYNVNVPGVVKFNASEVMEGFDFTAGATLVTLRFNVLDTAYSEISTQLEEMVELMGDDFVTGGDIKAELGVAEAITGNTGTDQPTTTIPGGDQPTTTIPGGQPTTTIPGGQTTTTAPVVPGTTADGSTPAPNTTDAQGSTGTNGGGNGTVTTGAATFIYVAIAVLTMAGVAVVVLRKRVNG